MRNVLGIVLIGGFFFLMVRLCMLCFEYSLMTIFGKDVPWYVDLLGGLILNGFNIPIAIVCWIIQLAGVEVPLFN